MVFGGRGKEKGGVVGILFKAIVYSLGALLAGS